MVCDGTTTISDFRKGDAVGCTVHVVSNGRGIVKKGLKAGDETTMSRSRVGLGREYSRTWDSTSDRLSKKKPSKQDILR